ncbi:MAG: hypothetical protein KatS3mg060_3733 [Dehalococcoidia bacterium]|nr:MAG: hypothetical protein KatS3mg060_3733 [Dehalococcoidia bacterium]
MVQRALGGWLIVLGFAIAVAWLLLVRSVLPAGPFLWDEGYHALWAARIAADLRAGDLLGVAYDSYRQVYWPPLYSWLVAPVILLGGYSTELVRSVGLIALVATSLTLYAAGRGFGSGNAALLGGLTASAVLLGSRAVLDLATQAMLELPALFFLASGLWLYGRIWCAGGVSSPAYAGLGAVIVLTFLAKQNYGVLLGLAIGGAFLIDGEWLRLRPSPMARRRRRGQLLAAGVTLLLLAVWFAYPQKIVQTLQSLRNTPWGPDASSLDGMLFYPRQLGWLAGTWWMAGVWLLALAASLRPASLRDGRLRLLLLLIVLQGVFAQLSATKIDRHIIPLVPAFALLVGAQASQLARIRPRLVLAAVVLVVVVQGVDVLPAIRPAGDPSLREPLLAAVAAVGASTLVVGNIDLPYSPATLDWELLRGGVLSVDGAGSLSLASESRFASGVLPRLPEPLGQPLRRLPERWPGAAGAATLYVGLPLDAPDLELRASGLPRAIASATGRRAFDRALAIVPISSPRFPDATVETVVAALQGAGFRAGADQKAGATIVVALER